MAWLVSEKLVEARKNLKTAEHTSNLDSETEECSTRKRRAKQHLYPGESSSGNDCSDDNGMAIHDNDTTKPRETPQKCSESVIPTTYPPFPTTEGHSISKKQRICSPSPSCSTPVPDPPVFFPSNTNYKQ